MCLTKRFDSIRFDSMSYSDVVVRENPSSALNVTLQDKVPSQDDQPDPIATLPVPPSPLLPATSATSSITNNNNNTTTTTNNNIKNNVDTAELLAPENFAVVEGGVYRSSFPRTKNIPFLRRLRLKTVISLVPEDYPQAMLEFYHSQGTRLLAHGLEGNKWPFKGVDFNRLQYVIRDILTPSNRPLLIHCNKGKHRTGSVVGCLRKQRNWALSAIFTEYLLFASPKTRLEDQMLIESFVYDSGFRFDSDTEKAMVKEMHKKNKLKRDEDEDEDDGSDGDDKDKGKKIKNKNKSGKSKKDTDDKMENNSTNNSDSNDHYNSNKKEVDGAVVETDKCDTTSPRTQLRNNNNNDNDNDNENEVVIL
jgi:protein tyrosine/serine phosphatase